MTVGEHGEPRGSREQFAVGAGIIASSILLGVAVAGALPGGLAVSVVVLGIALLPWLLIIPLDWLLVVTVVAAYTLDWLSQGLHVLPTQAAWLLEGLIAVFFVRCALQMRRGGSFRLSTPTWMLLGVTALSVCLALVSGAPGVVLLVGLRNHLRFVLLGSAIMLVPWDDIAVTRLWWTIFGVALLQIPATIQQLVTVGAGDAASGTMGSGGTGINATFLSALVAILIVFPGAGKENPKVRLWGGAAAIALFIPTIIGSAVISYLLVVIGVLFFLAVRTVLSRGRLAAVMVGSCLVLALIVAGSTGSSSLGLRNPVELYSSTQKVLKYDRQATQAGMLGRVDKLGIATATLAQGDIVQRVFGYGPGMASPSSLGAEYTGPIWFRPLVRFLTLGVTRELLELGIVGLCVALIVLVDSIRVGIIVFRKAPAANAKRMGLLACAMGVMLLVTGLYGDTWLQAGTAVAFWVSYGMAWRLARTEGGGAGEVVVDSPDTR